MPNTVQTLKIKNQEFCRKMNLKVSLFLTLRRATLDFSGLVWCLGLNLPQVFATSATCFKALNIYIDTTSEAEFKEFEPRHWTFNNQFQLSAGSNLKTLFKIFSWTNRVWTAWRPGSNSLNYASDLTFQTWIIWSKQNS